MTNPILAEATEIQALTDPAMGGKIDAGCNEIYIGSMVNCRHITSNYRTKKRVKQDKEDWIVVPDMHEPIISRELFDEAQKALAIRLNMTSNAKGPKAREDIFSGLFRCEACGTSMLLHRTGTGYYAYICRKHHQIGKCACSSHYINYDKFHAAVLADIKKHAVLFAEDTERAARDLLSKSAKRTKKSWRRPKRNSPKRKSGLLILT